MLRETLASCWFPLYHLVGDRAKLTQPECMRGTSPRPEPGLVVDLLASLQERAIGLGGREVAGPAVGDPHIVQFRRVVVAAKCKLEDPVTNLSGQDAEQWRAGLVGERLGEGRDVPHGWMEERLRNGTIARKIERNLRIEQINAGATGGPDEPSQALEIMP